MAQEDRNRLAEWVVLVRQQAPVLRDQLYEWVDEVRKQPRLIWESPAIRYSVYFLGAIILTWVVTGTASLVAPPPPPDAKAAATTADFHVICSDERCLSHFIIHKEFGFDDFPVVCPKCGEKRGQRALRCNSPTCRGAWIIPDKVGKMLRCPRCGDKLR